MKRLRGFTCILLTMVLVLTAAFSNPAVYAADDIKVTVNGSYITFSGQKPVVIDNYIFMGISDVMGKLGYKSSYDGGTKTLTLTNSANNNTFKIKMGSYNYTFNGTSYTLAVPAQIKNGTAMMTMGDVLYQIGYRAEYSSIDNTNRIDIDYVSKLKKHVPYNDVSASCATVFGKYITNCKWSQALVVDRTYAYVYIKGQIPADGLLFFAKGGTSVSVRYTINTSSLNITDYYVDLGNFGSISGGDAEEFIKKFFRAYSGNYKTLDGYLAAEMVADAAVDYAKDAALNWLEKKANEWWENLWK